MLRLVSDGMLHRIKPPPAGSFRRLPTLIMLSSPLLAYATSRIDQFMLVGSGGFPACTSLLLPVLIAPVATLLLGARTDWLELVTPRRDSGWRVIAYGVAAGVSCGLVAAVAHYGLHDLDRGEIANVQLRNGAAFQALAIASAIGFGLGRAWLLPFAFLVAVIFTGGNDGGWWSWPLDGADEKEVLIAWGVLAITAVGTAAAPVQRRLGM